jgi:hypothetical protein
MIDMLKKLMKEKGGNKVDPTAKKAKMGVLKEIRDMAASDMGEEVKGIKKVTVAAPDEAGLKEGLEKAEEIVKSSSSPCEICEKSPCACDGEGDSSEDDMSADEIEALIAELMAKKAKFSKASE